MFQLHSNKKAAARLNPNIFSIVLSYFRFRDLFKLRLINKYHFYDRAVPACFRTIEIGDSDI